MEQCVIEIYSGLCRFDFISLLIIVINVFLEVAQVRGRTWDLLIFVYFLSPLP